ncbi:MAG: four-carbon acid sugar kinase family protein [Paracoccaceae bacterium]
MTLRILADDLTGALDAAAPFAHPENPVRLCLGGVAPQLPRVTISTESRDFSAGDASLAVAAATERLKTGAAPETLWFKKVDSVLRGNPLTETLAMMQAGGFARCIFAPAFPAMGRMTRNGRHMVRNADDDWVTVPPGDLSAAFARLAPGLEILIPDAETQDGLRRAIAPWQGVPGTLWAGSRGLAEALAADVRPLPSPRISMFILGTTHPATRAQAARLLDVTRNPPSGGQLVPSAADPMLLDPVPAARNGAETRAALRDAARRLVAPIDGSAIYVVGGDSLTEVLLGAGAEALECQGEIGAGLPQSWVIGGRLNGVTLITKSGGFGGPDLLCGMLR